MQSLTTISILLILVLYAMSIGDYHAVPNEVTSEAGEEEEKMYDLFKIAEWRFDIPAPLPANSLEPVSSPVISLAPANGQTSRMVNHVERSKSSLEQSVSTQRRLQSRAFNNSSDNSCRGHQN